MRETKAQIMASANKEAMNARIIANNTVEYRLPSGERRIRLHHTDIIRYMPNGDIVVSTSGWQTVTTKERLNRYLNADIWQTKGLWYISYHGETYVYQDGIVLHPDGTVTDAGEDPKELTKLRRKAKKFAKDYIKAFRNGEVPKPSGADCWLCLLKDKDGATLDLRSDHVKSHIDEKYYVPSLLVNAVTRFPISPMAKHEIACVWENEPERSIDMGDFIWYSIEKCIRRWCYEQLGLPS